MMDAESTHYQSGGIESIDVMQAKMTPEQFIGYLLGNVLKYALRANFKRQWRADIRKLAIYAQRLHIEVEQMIKPTDEKINTIMKQAEKENKQYRSKHPDDEPK